jgi:hypothetical protein
METLRDNNSRVLENKLPEVVNTSLAALVIQLKNLSNNVTELPSFMQPDSLSPSAKLTRQKVVEPQGRESGRKDNREAFDPSNITPFHFGQTMDLNAGRPPNVDKSFTQSFAIAPTKIPTPTPLLNALAARRIQRITTSPSYQKYLEQKQGY